MTQQLTKDYTSNNKATNHNLSANKLRVLGIKNIKQLPQTTNCNVKVYKINAMKNGTANPGYLFWIWRHLNFSIMQGLGILKFVFLPCESLKRVFKLKINPNYYTVYPF